jgi:hypothetical protein
MTQPERDNISRIMQEARKLLFWLHERIGKLRLTRDNVVKGHSILMLLAFVSFFTISSCISSGDSPEAEFPSTSDSVEATSSFPATAQLCLRDYAALTASLPDDATSARQHLSELGQPLLQARGLAFVGLTDAAWEELYIGVPKDALQARRLIVALKYGSNKTSHVHVPLTLWQTLYGPYLDRVPDDLEFISKPHRIGRFIDLEREHFAALTAILNATQAVGSATSSRSGERE